MKIIVSMFNDQLLKLMMRVESMYANDEVHVRFDMGRKFARAYYRDELKAKGLNPDFNLSIDR